MKISIIAGVWMNNDAISDVIAQELSALAAAGLDDARVFAFASDRGDPRYQVSGGPNDVLFDAHFQRSELVVFHFGVYYSLFDALAATPRRARRIVVFHNITPKEHVPPDRHELIDRSFRQLSNAHWADHVLCDSQTNLDVLRSCGIEVPATVNPLTFDTRMRAPTRKPMFDDGVVRIAFIGRLVRSKGPEELLSAVGSLLQARPDARLRVDLIGNLHFSDARVVHSVKESAAALASRFGSRISVELSGNAADVVKGSVLQSADIFMLPTYHEGFCVPILEALANGCRVIAYDNSNIPSISGGLATLVTTGDIDRLTAALIDEYDRVTAPAWSSGPSGYRSLVDATIKHVSAYSSARFGERFTRLVEHIVDRPLRRPVSDAIVHA